MNLAAEEWGLDESDDDADVFDSSSKLELKNKRRFQVSFGAYKLHIGE